MKFLLGLFSHVCVIAGLMLIPLLIVDRFNPSMDFVNNDITKLLVFILAVAAILLGILQRIYARRNR